MAAIDSLMKKLGFVKLSTFGLVLTPEGRLLSMRPAVLDDGFGGKIVGWKDGDLAAAELERWEPRPASPQAVASRVAAARPPVPTQPLPVVRAPAPPRPTFTPVASAAPMAPIAREHVMQHVTPIIPTPPVAVSTASPAAIVASAPVVEEDDWEWTIAIARARAAAEDVEVSVKAKAPVRRMRADTVPPPVFTAKEPIASDSWDKTQVRVVRAPVPLPIAPPPPVIVAPPTIALATTRVVGPAPSTVIPIPRLPTTLNPNPRSSAMTPVVRQTLPTPILPAPPRRFAKGTAPVLPQSTSSIKPPATPPVRAMSDDTLPNLSLPPAAVAVAIPSIKRLQRG